MGPFARIAARYIVGALVAYGAFAPEDATMIEPDVALLVGAIAGAAVEALYSLAKRKGWAT